MINTGHLRIALLLLGSVSSVEALTAQSEACTPNGAPRMSEQVVTLGASLPPVSLVTTYPEQWRIDLLTRWVSAFQAPEQWMPEATPGVYSVEGDPSGIAPFGPGGQYVVRLRRNGHIDRIKVERASGSAMLDSAVVRAFRRVDSLGGFGELPASIPRSRAEWRVVVGVAHGLGRDVTPLAVDTMQGLMADVAPTLLKRTNPSIATMSSSQAGGGFVVRYIVTREGKVDPASVRVVWSSSPDIAKAAVKSARTGEYTAGTAGGCTVPVVVVWRNQLGAGPYDPSVKPAADTQHSAPPR